MVFWVIRVHAAKMVIDCLNICSICLRCSTLYNRDVIYRWSKRTTNDLIKITARIVIPLGTSVKTAWFDRNTIGNRSSFTV